MKLYIVGTGAGNAGGMTLDAQSAIQASDIVVGYTLYVELLRSIFPDKNYLSTGMKSEVERVKLALSEAQNGKNGRADLQRRQRSLRHGWSCAGPI